MEKKCSSYTLITVLVTTLIIVALTTTVSRIVFRYRWKLRYMYYVAKEKYHGQVFDNDIIRKSPYRFDAFISYADKDSSFVFNITRKLENEYDLRLCIHHRDFIPGTEIMDNITNAVHCSRRTVCIMTSHFLDSYWCMFELNMARMEAIYSRKGRNVLFLIILEKNAMKNVPLFLMDLIESQSYLEYPDEEAEEEIAFRSRLGETLKSNDCDF
ncbi:toll-like receptor 4 [Saccostrea echinata]|nr:toll-like receptor 4 [Saccostrea echinata]